MEVDLKNPGEKIAAISFVIQSSKLTLTIINGIDVRSPAGQRNLFPAGSVTFDRHPTIDAVKLTPSPIRVFAANQNVKFVVTVPGLDTVNILSGFQNNNGTMLGGPPQWFNNDDPPKEVNPAPTLPGFAVKPKDAEHAP